MFLESICLKFIRPKRLEYSQMDLGSSQIQYHWGTLIRHDIIVQNRQGDGLKCSYFEITPKSDCCIIYCHGFNGCRVEAIKYAHTAASYGLNFCIFDFQACGQSDGQFITFGQLEQYDLTEIIQEMKRKFQQNQFILWGRSLGATIIQLQKQPYISGYVLDSCFIDLNKASIKMIQKITSLPKLMIKSAMYILKNKIEQQGNFKFDDIKIRGPDSSVPTLYICSDQDTVINSKNSTQLYQQHQGLRELIKIQGDHNAIRNIELIHQICQWCKDRFIIQLNSYTNLNVSPLNIRKKYSYLTTRDNLQKSPSEIIHKYVQSNQINPLHIQSCNSINYNKTPQNNQKIKTQQFIFENTPPRFIRKPIFN